jgi:hypothetical protein
VRVSVNAPSLVRFEGGASPLASRIAALGPSRPRRLQGRADRGAHPAVENWRAEYLNLFDTSRGSSTAFRISTSRQS